MNIAKPVRVTCHEPAAGFVEMIKVTPGVTACRLTIQLRPAPGGSEADVTYTHTSLGPEGDAFVASFDESTYRRPSHFSVVDKWDGVASDAMGGQ